jgi:RNA polymerase sigma-70 factor (ECF subfamily)
MEQELRHLLLAGMDGDASAYRDFLQQVSTLLRGYFRRRLQGLPDEVEDLLQETLMALHTQRHTYRREELLTPWVHALARYKLVDLWRRRARHEALNDPLDEAADWLVAPESSEGESRRDLVRLLQALPDHQRLPIQHTKIEGLSVAEAARLTCLSESAVKVGVHRGIKALARLWKETT